MREITYIIQRFDGTAGYEQAYRFAHESGQTILWGLIKIKQELDPTLTFTASCRSAICGACAVRVNGQALLACEASLDKQLARYHTDTLNLAPIANFSVIRDLAVDWQPKLKRMETVKPWILPHPEFTPETGCQQSPADFQKINIHAGCILCGACASECSKLSANAADFLEPFIYSQAQKFVDDSRDQAHVARIEAAVENGVWKCMNCGECAAKCPKKLTPRADIVKLRQASIKYGLADNTGVRHAKAFYHDVRTTGRLNELNLPIKTEGFIKSIKQFPFALRLLRRGKLNPLRRPRPVAGLDNIKHILHAAGEEG